MSSAPAGNPGALAPARRFDGKAALVTGAGGDIGAAAARQLAGEGARLVLFDRKLELLAATVSACRELGAEVVADAVDQTDRDRVARAIGSAWEKLGRIDVLFANAGYGRFSTFLATPHTEWQRHVDVNLNGTFHVCQETAGRMATDARGGAIVVNASCGAVNYSDQLSAYCTTKAALRMLTVAMASELGIHRIRVNAVMPGVIETGMTRPMLADDRHRQVLLADTPVGRLGQPDDVARLVCFLASDEAAFITGEAVLVDGGQVIHGHPRWFRVDYRRPFEEEWEIGR
jgi:NAD(P)-dependent dehydrogenase (short-subunit alcohol dehydrogenase family)